MKPHACIAMPCGTRRDADGQLIDFNRIHDELQRPALLEAGCEIFRADQQQCAGSIDKDKFQELLVTDLVRAELTIDNPNVDGADKVRLVCLWDGSGSDGPGGTTHRVEEVRKRTGRVSWIDVRTL